ncbi:pollen-specific leucine-rich repeat extensin-like protein 2 [Capsella rubella]|uniref:pollen-specific leucine-rich repeat extensin-like protein 2 n=1 Tax=Capsella rubella TaxID=81985 RepID=UPI000CD5A70B|nr:pollen-specific leucine-rich repeat extensin-like protein 2 [Capsella rubella]
MECNKDEARRAMDIAARRVSESDYNGAKKFVNKAQTLYPNLDGLKQVLMMIDVYIFASDKTNGEADWYGVLGVDPLADDDAVKRQYKKLALLLHPDKNKFKGAEGAFKLLSQAWCLLSDKVKRSAYDQKRKSKEAKTPMQKPPNPSTHKPASHNGNQNAGGGVYTSAGPAGASSDKPANGMPKPPNPTPKPASYNVNQNARGGVNTSAEASSDKPASGMPKPPTPHKPASSNGRHNARGGYPSAGVTSDKPACGMPKPPNPHKSPYSYVYQNARDRVDPSPKATSYTHAPSPTPTFASADSPNMQKYGMLWTICNRCKTQCLHLEHYFGCKSIPCQKCGHLFTPTQVVKPVNCSSSSQQQQQNSAQKKATNKNTNGASSSPSAAQKTPQASAKSQATNKNTNGAFSSGNVYASSASVAATTPLASVVRPVHPSSFPTKQQQWSAQNIATNKSTNEASSSRINCSTSTSAAPKPPQASAKSQATNKNTNKASSSQIFSSPAVSATAKTPQGSFMRPVVNLSSSPQLQQQQQWSAQSTSDGTYSQTFSSSSVSYTYSFQWNCSVSVTGNSSSTDVANQAQESLKRVQEESQKAVAVAEKVLKKPRANGRYKQ